MTDFTRIFALKGLSIYVLKNTVSEKTLPPEYMMADVDEMPEDFDVPIHEVTSVGNFNPIVESVFDLPVDDDDFSIRATHQGLILMKVSEHWLQIGSARAV